MAEAIAPLAAPATAPATDRAARIAYLRALPKAELHLHLEGALRPELLLQLAERNRIRIPFSHPDDFQRLYRYRDFRDFGFALTRSSALLRTPQDFHDAVADLGAMLAAENCRYAEITWTPQMYVERGLDFDDLLAAMNAARHAIEARSGLVIRWLPDVMRSGARLAGMVAQWAVSPAARAGGVVALGLGGPEAGFPAERFRGLFDLTRQAGLPANPHTGEGDGPAAVRATLAALQPTRIGHGVRAAEDADLVAELARRAIPFEVCLTSNVRLGVVASYGDHPVRRLIDAGCVVTLNTDDPVLFGTSLTREYLLAVEQCGLSLDQVRAAILAAVRSSYLGAAEKAAMLADFTAEFARLAPLLPDAAARAQAGGEPA